LGIDFSIHTLDRLRTLHATYGIGSERIYSEFYQTTGRALFFNFLAVACGFGVLISSKIVSLNNFGSIVVLAVTTSFIASMTLLPALIKLTQPGFIMKFEENQNSKRHRGILPATLLVALLISMVLAKPVTVGASEILEADQIVANINAVKDGAHVTRKLTMTMTDRHGKQREQESVNYRKYFASDKKTVMFFQKPANIRDTGFLIWNYADPTEEDDQWLYLPALRKVRRVSAADRGDYFLGTDFTYEDMKLDGKFEPLDYTFVLQGEESLDGVLTHKLEATPRSEDIARELGYSKTVSWVDPRNWTLVKVEFHDQKGKLLKTLTADDIRQIDGYWTRHRLTMHNQQTGHQTEFVFSDVDYVTPIKDSLFSKQALARGQ
jgi:outer membrane lipoprotein-sorting protein